MESSVIAVVPLGNEKLVVWFAGGVSKCYDASELGMDDVTLRQVHVTQDGSAIAWGDATLDAQTLLSMGEEVDYVSKERLRLLKSLSGIRREASFSQTRLGEAAGIRQSVISRIEGCEISPQINTLIKLLAPLGKTLAIVDLDEREEHE